MSMSEAPAIEGLKSDLLKWLFGALITALMKLLTL